MQAHLRSVASSTAQIRLWPMARHKFLFFRPSSRPLRARPPLDSKPTVSLNCRARQVFWRRFLCSSAVSSAAAQRPAVVSCTLVAQQSAAPVSLLARHLHFYFHLAISALLLASNSRPPLPIPDCTSSRPIRRRRLRIARRNHDSTSSSRDRPGRWY